MKSLVFGLSLSALPAFAGALPDFSHIPDMSHPKPELPVLAEGAVYMIFAHADDELTISGQVAYLHEQEPARSIHWIMVSDNQTGKIQAGTCLPGESPSACRAKEAAASGACVGIEAPLRMGLLDGGLDQISTHDLAVEIQNVIQSTQGREKIAAFFTSDEMGFYGHPDHIAVHDAVQELAQAGQIPMIVMAVPDEIKPLIPLNPRIPPVIDGGQSRPRHFPAVTHSLSIEPTVHADLRAKLICAEKAHASQANTLASYRAGLGADEFYRLIPRQFFNLMAFMAAAGH